MTPGARGIAAPRGARRAPLRTPAPRPTGLRATPPLATAAGYAVALVGVVGAVEREVDEILRAEGLPIVRTDAAADGDGPSIFPDALARIQRKLDEFRERLASREPHPLAAIETCAAQVDRHTEGQWKQQLARLGVKLSDVRAPHLEHLRALWQHRNLDLIKALRLDVVDRVRAALDEHRGARVETLARRIEEATGSSRSYARFVARDQALKLANQITQARHQAAGVTEYVWRASRDERVRKRHKELDGTRQSYAHPPIVDERTGRRAHPGDDYQCRCTADPIIPGVDL